MWFIDVFTTPLKAKIDLLEKDNESLRARLREFEVDDREIRRGLFTRAGLLPQPEREPDKRGELKPIKKVTVPWNVQAAKLEADSRERYWKKVIEDREALDRRVSAGPTTPDKTENEQIQEDIEELSR